VKYLARSRRFIFKIQGNANTNTPKSTNPETLVTPPSVARETFDALLGFAIMSFGDMHDIGRGPLFTSRELNARQVSNKRREDFIRAVGGDPLDPTQPPKNLRRFDVENAITILVPKDVVDMSSLVKNPKDSNDANGVKHIAWRTKQDNRCTVANGAGRIDFLQNFLCREQISAINTEMHLSKKNAGKIGHEMRLAETTRIIDEAREILKTTSNWLVGIYDLGMQPFISLSYYVDLKFPDAIERSENATQIKLALASNAPPYQAPDSEDEALHLILTTISPLPKENWLRELNHHKVRIASGPKRLAPVIRNERLIMSIINSHRYARFWEDNMKVTQYYDWRTTVSPVRIFYIVV
jgi:hypothetical protein